MTLCLRRCWVFTFCIVRAPAAQELTVLCGEAVKISVFIICDKDRLFELSLGKQNVDKVSSMDDTLLCKEHPPIKSQIQDRIKF